MSVTRSVVMTAKEIQKEIERHRDQISNFTTLSAHNVKPAEIAKHQAEIFVLASQLAEISSRRIVRLTWALVFLTAALLFFTIALYEDTHFQIQRYKAANNATEAH